MLSYPKIMLLGMYSCNYDQSKNPKNCQLYAFSRNLGFPDDGDYKTWYEWVLLLSDKEAEEIYGNHLRCDRCIKTNPSPQWKGV